MSYRPFLIVSAAATVSLGAGALAQPPADIADLAGARAAGGETQMEARGYQLIRTNTVRDQKWSFWWNARTHHCASVATADGRYSTINAVPSANCDQSGEVSPASPAASVLPEETLALICWGEGQKPSVDTRSGWEWNADNKRFESTVRTESSTQTFSSEILVEITGQHGHIRLAGPLIPIIRSGGRDGWWDLQDLRVDRQTISGRYHLNGLNKPRVVIDRRIGRITIDGIEHFQGSCEDANKARDNPRF